MSLKIGELGVLPKIRSAPPETLFPANGTSCPPQIRDSVGREDDRAVGVANLAARATERDRLIRIMAGRGKTTRDMHNTPPECHCALHLARGSFKGTKYGIPLISGKADCTTYWS
jgi:hypothetical protein